MIGYVAKDSINGRGMCKTMHRKKYIEYSQLLPCVHPAVAHTLIIIWTAA